MILYTRKEQNSLRADKHIGLQMLLLNVWRYVHKTKGSASYQLFVVIVSHYFLLF